jgi:predicted nucleic acid-binding protein
VTAWVESQDNSVLHLSIVSVGELRKGIHLLSQGNRREQLERWFEAFLLPLFSNRILPVTQGIADRWGILSADCKVIGKPLNTADGLIAATAIVHDLTVVTRNIKDFADLGITLLNPWET